jgi:hypothetical protein
MEDASGTDRHIIVKTSQILVIFSDSTGIKGSSTPVSTKMKGRASRQNIERTIYYLRYPSK